MWKTIKLMDLDELLFTYEGEYRGGGGALEDKYLAFINRKFGKCFKDCASAHEYINDEGSKKAETLALPLTPEELEKCRWVSLDNEYSSDGTTYDIPYEKVLEMRAALPTLKRIIELVELYGTEPDDLTVAVPRDVVFELRLLSKGRIYI